jgi:hypothetical protein
MPLPAAETLAPRIDEYLQQKISANHAELIEDAASQLAANGTPAFTQGFELQVTGVPVGARHGRFVERSLSLLAIQAERAPTVPAVVLSLNHPKYNWESAGQVAENVAIVKSFQREHPRLPLSYFVAGYEDGVPIGDIRDGAFGAAAILHKQRSNATGKGLKDLIFTNWDIDTLDATPDYFARLQHSYRQHGQPIWTAHPNTQHARTDPERLPDANRLIAWYDLGVRASKASLPAHYSTNFHSWLLGGGYMGGDFGEHGAFRRRLEGQLPRGETVPAIYLGTSVTRVSPHRFMGNMAAGDGIGYSGLHVINNIAEEQPLRADISAGYFNAQLQRLIPQAGSPAYLRREAALKEAGMSPNDTAQGAKEYARRFLQASAAVIGDVHGTADCIASYIK